MRQRARPIQNNRNALDNRLGADVINARVSVRHSVHDRDNAGRMPALRLADGGGDDALGTVAVERLLVRHLCERGAGANRHTDEEREC